MAINNQKSRAFIVTALGSFVFSLGACSFIARDADAYRQATREALMTQESAVEGCYDQAIAADASAGGQVVVNFVVEKKTGRLIEPAIDEQATNAPSSLSQCVLRSLEGVALAQPDRRQGQATFTWSFATRAAEGPVADASPASE
jgi:hypothetical protein